MEIWFTTAKYEIKSSKLLEVLQQFRITGNLISQLFARMSDEGMLLH